MLRWKDKKIEDLDRGKLAKNSGTYALLLVALFAMAFFGVCDPQERLAGPKGAAAKIGGEVVTAKEFRRAYQSAYQRMQSQYQEAFDPASMQLSKTVLKQLVDERVLYAKALAVGLRATEDEILKLVGDAEIFKDEKGGGFNAEAFNNYLRSNGHTEASFMEDLRRSITVQKFREFVTSSTYVSKKAAELEYRVTETKLDVEYLKFDPADVKVAVSDADVTAFLNEDGKKRVKEYYDSNAAEFNQAEQVHARHILVAYKGARNAAAEVGERTKEDAKKRADDLAVKVKAPGADFIKIANESTDEAAGKKKGGDLGFFAREAMVKEFSDAAFGLKPGQISAAVESPFGFHIIKVEAVKEKKSETLEAATPVIARKLIEKDKKPALVQERADKVFAALKAGKPADDLLKEYGAAWKATGEIAAGNRSIPGVGSDKPITDAVAGLKTPGQMHDAVLVSHDSRFILKLKSRKDADMAKLDDVKRKELGESATYGQGYALFSSVEKMARKDLQDRGKIWENPDFANLDLRRAASKDGDAGSDAAGS